MEKVKIFFEVMEDRNIQSQVNRWLKEMEGKIEIVQRLMSTTGAQENAVTIAIFYKEKQRRRK